MSETAIATKDIHVFARTPLEMSKAQDQMVLWATSKVERQFEDLREAQENYRVAKQNKWRSQPWDRRVKLAKAKITFYQKLRSALKAGYYIVPPFPVDIFAIRTDRKKPTGSRVTTYKWDNPTLAQNARRLPEGKGRYVSSDPEVWQRDLGELPGHNGESVQKYEDFAKVFQEVDFPFKMVKPEVMTAAAEAMALKVFDQLGVLPRYMRRGDPIVVGQILPPGQYAEPVTFFVAWWLNTEDL